MRSLFFCAAALLGLTVWFGKPQVARAADAPVVVVTIVPADATVWFDGTKTTQTGMTRRFVSPPVAAGRTYAYRIRVVAEGDRKLDETRRLSVQAGDQITLDFSGAQVREARGKVRDSGAGSEPGAATYRRPSYEYSAWQQPRVSSFADQSPFQGYSWSPWGIRAWDYLTIGPFDR